MAEKIERALLLEAEMETVWEAVIGDGWLADEVMLDLRPGGDAQFRSGDELKEGWIEDVQVPQRLIFWWSAEGEVATRVELRLEPEDDRTMLRVIETRPLELLDLVGTPLRRLSGDSYGPALLAA